MKIQFSRSFENYIMQIIEDIGKLPEKVNLLPLLPFLLIAAGYCLVRIFTNYGVVGERFYIFLPVIPMMVVIGLVVIKNVYSYFK